MGLFTGFLETEIVFDLDSHHDNDDEDTRLTCGNWVLAAKRGKHIIYKRPPQLKDGRWSLRVFPRVFDLVFLCRSSPWTPWEFDKLFNTLIAEIARKSATPVRWYGHRAKELQIDFRYMEREGRLLVSTPVKKNT